MHIALVCVFRTLSKPKVDLGSDVVAERVFYGLRHVCAIVNDGMVKVSLVLRFLPSFFFYSFCVYELRTRLSSMLMVAIIYRLRFSRR